MWLGIFSDKWLPNNISFSCFVEEERNNILQDIFNEIVYNIKSTK